MPTSQAPIDPLQFLEEQERIHRAFHVEFRLAYGPNSDRTPGLFEKSLDRWFGGPAWRDDKCKLSIIGTDWTGGMFCTWQYPELNGRLPPVVYMGSEGNALSVVAIDTRAFVELLATGRIWGRYEGRFDDDEQPPAHALFARTARDTFGFGERSAEAIQREGAGAHPDFHTWVQQLVS